MGWNNILKYLLLIFIIISVLFLFGVLFYTPLADFILNMAGYILGFFLAFYDEFIAF